MKQWSSNFKQCYKLSTEQYLAQERHADHKSELIYGLLFPLAGASAPHNLLTGKVHACLLLALEDLDYTVFMSDMRLGLPNPPTYTYPAILVVRGTPQFQSESETEGLNPCLIGEVLSKSTSDDDKNDKFQLYKTIPSLEEYILVSQTEYAVSQYIKPIKQDDILNRTIVAGYFKTGSAWGQPPIYPPLAFPSPSPILTNGSP